MAFASPFAKNSFAQPSDDKVTKVNIGDDFKCFSVTGEPVRYIPVSSTREPFAWFDKHNAPVVLLPQKFVEQKSMLSDFLKAHECAHHHLGHSYALRSGQVLDTIKMRHSFEKDADCFAAIKISQKQKYTKSDFRKMFSNFTTRPPLTHPTPDARLESVMSCLDQYYQVKGQAFSQK